MKKPLIIILVTIAVVAIVIYIATRNNKKPVAAPISGEPVGQATALPRPTSTQPVNGITSFDDATKDIKRWYD